VAVALTQPLRTCDKSSTEPARPSGLLLRWSARTGMPPLKMAY